MCHCLLDLSCSECNVILQYFLCFSVNGYVCLLCYVSDSVCELFAETIRKSLGAVKCYGRDECGGSALLDVGFSI